MSNYRKHETAIVDEGCTIGDGTAIWHFSHIISGAHIGNNCSIGQNVMIAANVRIGNSVKIQNNISIFTGVTIEDDVFLGPGMIFTNVSNPRGFLNRKDQHAITLVEKGATIGANAVIIGGIKVGKYCLVGAGSVATKDIPDFALMVGNPATQIGWVSRLAHRLQLDEEGIGRCPESGEMYKLIDGMIKLIE